ncbi:MAG: radical SAM protein [Candidatus Pacebacteria bacterium]|nr:radical SAM protein [Candidatus Paceibacterota bacterium]
MDDFNLEKKFKMSPVFTVLIGLLYRCQCNCVHCAVADYSKSGKELTTAEVIKLMNQLPDVLKKSTKEKKIHVQFTGGEPLLRKDLLILIKYAHQRSFEPQLNTNGLLLTETMVKKLKKAGLKKVAVSIDSSNDRIHDAARGVKGCFKSAIIGMKNCLRGGIKCCIGTCANNKSVNNGELEKIILLGKKIGVDYIRIIPSVLAGKWQDKGQGLNKNNLWHLEKLKDSYKDFVMFEGNLCGAYRKKSITISPYGDVLACPYIPITFGNIREESLTDILSRMFLHPIFKTKIRTGECFGNNQKIRKRYFKTKRPKGSLIRL